jgi:hypothetical protein
MAERKRGITERLMHVINPLPDVGEAVLLERAGLDMLEPSKLSPFVYNWKYSGGLETEIVQLNPGDHVALRESEVKEFMAEFKDLGAIAVPADCDEETREKAVLKGLQTAHRHYHNVGGRRIVELKKGRGYSKEDLEDHKYDHWVYHLNAARADVIAEQIKALRKNTTPSRRK